MQDRLQERHIRLLFFRGADIGTYTEDGSADRGELIDSKDADANRDKPADRFPFRKRISRRGETRSARHRRQKNHVDKKRGNDGRGKDKGRGKFRVEKDDSQARPNGGEHPDFGESTEQDEHARKIRDQLHIGQPQIGQAEHDGRHKPQARAPVQFKPSRDRHVHIDAHGHARTVEDAFGERKGVSHVQGRPKKRRRIQLFGFMQIQVEKGERVIEMRCRDSVLKDARSRGNVDKAMVFLYI